MTFFGRRRVAPVVPVCCTWRCLGPVCFNKRKPGCLNGSTGLVSTGRLSPLPLRVARPLACRAHAQKDGDRRAEAEKRQAATTRTKQPRSPTHAIAIHSSPSAAREAKEVRPEQGAKDG